MPNKNRNIIIVGLGNPDVKYANTRHNVGHMVVDALNKVTGDKVQGIVIKKTDVFMNNSGEAVKRLITNHTFDKLSAGHSLITDLYVVHDDLDIPLGQFKIQFGKGPKDHNGIKSVEEELGTKEFWRIRVGIENRVQGTHSTSSGQAGDRVQGEEYVLQNFLPEEKKIIENVTREIATRLRELK
ncbi:peptidyl-tRNA hydrolase [Candidatus Microgenomates bacterium]|nr:peptidyl-tRNA hydrolase [Candidatus Microgenomates bacterium]